MTPDSEPQASVSLTRDAPGVLRLTLHQPRSRNAIRAGMWADLCTLAAELAAMPDLRVVVLCGAGGDFSSGADLGEFLALRSEAAATARYNATARQAIAAIGALPVPVLAEVRGVCMGAGLALAVQADLICLAEDSRIAIPAARIGVAYDPDWVVEMICAGRAFSGAQAVARGLAAVPVPGATLGATVGALAADIARGAPLTMRATKLALRPDAATPEGARRARAAAQACDDSDDYRQAIAALGRKEKVEFKGK